MIKKFRETGSLLDKNRNRQKSVLTLGILQDIQTAITRYPHKSLRKLSAQTGISLGSAHTAVRKMLKFYPYRMQVFHELISRRRIIGPLFFETTINAEAYQGLIQQFIALLQVDERNCWFQHDSITAHTATSTMEILHEFFGENVISKGVWPTRSPDLTSPDFFLWSYLKDTVYRSKPRDLKQLKVNIAHAIEEVNERMLRKFARNVVKRVSKCLEINGHHFQQLL
jgi:hypothetical protein